MAMILFICDYPCRKVVSDNVYYGKNPDSANGSSKNHSPNLLYWIVVAKGKNSVGSSLICCETLALPYCNMQRRIQTTGPYKQ